MNEVMERHSFRVLRHDFGIRPAGPQDRCFYCDRKIGEEHKQDCVVIVRDIKYRIFHKGREIGTLDSDEPSQWTNQDCEDHHNKGSWCKSNLLHHPGFNGDREALESAFEHGCGCDGSIVMRVAERGHEIRRAGDR